MLILRSKKRRKNLFDFCRITCVMLTMKIYRCALEDEVKATREGMVFPKRYGCGSNTFTYAKHTDYKHFFLFAETAQHYKDRQYRNTIRNPQIIQTDISENIEKGWQREHQYKEYLLSIPRCYLADYESGAFMAGYNEESARNFLWQDRFLTIENENT